MTNAAPRTEDGSVISRFFAKFAVLKDAIPELWISFAIKILSIAGYALTNSTIVLWLHSDLGYRDDNALYIVLLWSSVMTAVTLLAGSLTDVLGFRRTLFIGTALCIVSRAVMVCTTARWAALVLGLAPLAIGEALGGPVLVAVARRYSNTRQRSMSFSIIYAMMNLGFAISGWLFDLFRKGMGEQGRWDQTNLFFFQKHWTWLSFHIHLPWGLHTTTYQTLFFVSLIMEVLLLPLIWLLREGAEATDDGVKITPRTPTPTGRSYLKSAILTIGQATRETVGLFGTLLKQIGFYRLLAFLCLIAFVKMIYLQMDYVYPIFGVRELGPGAPIGTLWAMNSLLILFLAPLVGALTQRYSAYSMVILGGVISAASIFIMALPPAMFLPIADGWAGNFIGHSWLGLSGAVHPYYVMILLFVVLLSVGEAFYSPRVYEYAAAIAPKGQEASYGALSYLPRLLAKLLIGSFSGKSLMKYCPETGPRHSEMLWLIVGLFSLIAPVGLIALRRLIQVHEAGRDDDAAAAA